MKRQRARSDQAHVALQYVEELRELVNAGLANDTAQGRHSRIPLDFEEDSLLLHLLKLFQFGELALIGNHRAELQAGEVFLVQSPALLGEHNRSLRSEFDRQRYENKHRPQQDDQN